MARIRNLRPAFFKDEHLAELPALTRLLFQGLWTIADKAGNLEDRPRFIKVEVLPYDDCDIDAMLDALVSGGFVRRYEVADRDYLHIPKFTTHQRVSGDEAKAPTFIPPPDEAGKKQVRSREEAGPKHVRDRSTEIGVLKSVHCVTEGATAPTQSHVVPIDGSAWGPSPARAHSPNNAHQARRKGLSVPQFLHDELLSKLATPDEPALFAWYAETERTYDGKAVGETNLQFWRKRFEEWQGATDKAKPADESFWSNVDYTPSKFRNGGAA
jgi:hypothetical protein